MRKLTALLTVLLLGVSSVVYANELPADATSVRVVKVFRNVSGASTGSGTAFILQNASDDSNVLIGADAGRESSLGLDVTTTTTADDTEFVGCQVDDACVDDGLCRVVVWGPAICRWAGSTDNTNTRMATVGTTTVAGQLGSGTDAGLTMSLTLDGDSNDAEQNGLEDDEYRWIWVDPSRD